MANVTGTNGNDTISPALVSEGVVGIPTAGDDIILALDGNDTVSGVGVTIRSMEAMAMII